MGLTWLRLLGAAVVLALVAVACSAEPTVTYIAESASRAEVAGADRPELKPTGPEKLPRPADVADATPDPTPVPLDPVVAAGVAPVEELLAVSRLDKVDCPDGVGGDRVQCLTATLPRDISNPRRNQTVELMLALVDNGDPVGAGPVVFLQGGPGVGSVRQASSFAGNAHDVLFVDQRGTGFSSPNLDCSELDDVWEAQYHNDPEVRLEDREATLIDAYSRCAERLDAEGVALEDFNTLAAATDFELIRLLLGYDSWSIWGISYGTRLGLSLMRHYPNGIRAAVLDSVLPFEVDFFATIPKNGLRSFDELGDACADNPCGTTHGDFGENLRRLVKRLDEEPAVIDVIRPGTGTQFPFRVNGQELLNLAFTQMYSTRLLRSLPRQVARADAGGLNEMVSNFVLRRDPSQLELAEALYYSTWCREELPFHNESADDAFLARQQSDFGDALANALGTQGTADYCEIFSVPPAREVEDQPVDNVAIPTLVFAGRFDPITPPQWSRQVAESLPNTTYFEFADTGHGMTSACSSNIRLAFLTDPLALLDGSCVDSIGDPKFD